VVLDEDELFTYMAEEPLETHEANILTKITGQGALEGSFRVVLGGQSLVRAQIHARHMLPITGAEASGREFNLTKTTLQILYSFLKKSIQNRIKYGIMQYL